MISFVTALLITSLTMSAVIGLLLLTGKAFGNKVTAAFRCRLWLIVLLGFLIPYRPSIPLPFEPLRIPALVEPAAELAGAAGDRTSPGGFQPAAPAVLDPAPFSLPAEKPPVDTADTAWILFWVWATGAFCVMAFHLWTYLKFVSSIRRWSESVQDERILSVLEASRGNIGVRRGNINLQASALVNSPMLFGFTKPTILLPEQMMGADELACVFRHELAHYRRGDLWMNLLVLTVSAVHWFNPLVWLMARVVRADCEAACDSVVVTKEDARGRRRYGEAIIGFVGIKNTGGPVLSTYFYGGSSIMKKRLASIMDTGRASKWLAALSFALVLAVTVMSGGAFAAVSGSQTYIGDAKAKSIALRHAGVQENQATFLKAFLDNDDGRVVYDVEFYSGNTEYDYEVDAVSGKIVEYDRDIEYYSIPSSQRSTTNAGNYIGEAAAKSAALTHAGLTGNQVTFIKAYLDYDDRRVVYDIEFYSGTAEYDYKIDAVSGDIVEFDRALEYHAILGNASGNTTSAQNNTGNYIGEAKAKAVALAHAGVTEAQTASISAHLDRDDGRMDYDVQFYAGNAEYEYEIDAVNGSILEYSRETRNRNSGGGGINEKSQSEPVSEGNYIGESQAKSIALGNAGLTESQVTRLEVEFDYDNGRAVYEVDFNNDRMEYEYEIDALTGAIRESNSEYDD